LEHESADSLGSFGTNDIEVLQKKESVLDHNKPVEDSNVKIESNEFNVQSKINEDDKTISNPVTTRTAGKAKGIA
jgi:hypothetical protein